MQESLEICRLVNLLKLDQLPTNPSVEKENTAAGRRRMRQTFRRNLRTGNILIVNVSGRVALILIGEKSGVSCWIGYTHTELYLPCVTGGPRGLRGWPLAGDTNPNRLSQMRRNDKLTHAYTHCPSVCVFVCVNV